MTSRAAVPGEPDDRTPTGDILAQGDPEQQPRRIPWPVLAALMLLALAAWWIDARLAEAESTRVLDEVSEVETEVAQAQARIAGMVAYAWPVLTAADVDPAVRADLEGLVSEAAGLAVAPLAESGQVLGSVRVLPWHGTARAAQEAGLAYVRTRVAELQAVAADAGARAVTRPEIATTRERLRQALLALGPDLAPRVEEVLPAG